MNARFLPILALVSAIAGLANGCVSSAKTVAATTLSCSTDGLTESQVTHRITRVVGCGQTDFLIYMGGAADVSLLRRTRHDLNCEQGQISLQHLGGDVVGVTGCGTNASYVGIAWRGWVLNSDQR